jgi:D-glycero-beta-D-manno-heptose-7-phosphate kinase
MHALAQLLDRAARRTVLVVGDVMLDHFVFGAVTRISPEAPVPVVQFERDEYRLGGAANVAHNVVALGGRARIVAAVGVDDEGKRLTRDLTALPVDTSGIVEDPARCTTRKLRVVTSRNQQVARIDYETDAEVAGDVERAAIERVYGLAESADVILVSDYLKGFVSRALSGACVAAARRHDIPVLIDPKVPHIDYYSGATLVTPMRIRSRDEAREAARRFRARANCESVLITRGEHGMWLLGPEGEAELAAEAREVADVTGAGDTVIAALALGLAAGATLADAAALANKAAGIVVGKFGPAVVTRDELEREERV